MTDPTKPTIVLVHGAFAESASWNGAIVPLTAAGHRVIAAANHLRSVATDAASVASVIDGVDGPVILVGHSYGGAVISTAAAGKENVAGLVFIAGFAPDVGESAATLSGKFPGSSLGETLQPFPLAGGGVDLYIQPERFHAQFCADVDDETAAQMAATQRPITEAALNEASTVAAWKDTPSWFLIPELDRNIPAAVHRFMAERAGSRRTVEIAGGSHSVGVAQPSLVVDLVLEAAAALAPATA
jgi:pimeloyl-ACP methyl ester carboxylesterase